MKIIYQNSEGGVSVIHPTGALSIEEVAAKDVPEGLAYEIVEDDVIPSDRTFRDAWRKDGTSVVENLAAAKEIAHAMRRTKREQEFKPHDDLIAKQIPGTDTDAAEASRATIRTKYATMQTGIDAATTTAEIKAALEDAS